MEDAPQNNAEKTQQVQNPERRRLLKLLAAGGAATAVSMLPGKWSSPVVKTGVLPAHAQVTPGRFTVVCDPEWSVSPVDGFTTFDFSAVAFDGANVLPNVSLTANLTVGGASDSATSTTDANGRALFQLTFNDNDISQTPAATVTFTDTQLYGNDSCTIIFQILA